MRPSHRYLAFGLSLLGLAACSTARASGFVDNDGDNPKNVAPSRSLQFIRDSVFHSYLDSLDLRIQTLSQTARTVDSLARTLRGNHALKLHINGHCFGPLHIPSQQVGSDSITVTTPDVDVPQIEIPEMDIEVPHVGSDGTMYYDGKNGVSFDGNPRSEQRVIVNPNSSSIITGLTGPTSTYYYSQGDSRYYIRNVKPSVKAKRAANSSSVWLLDSK